jgi:hypothetical protein
MLVEKHEREREEMLAGQYHLYLRKTACFGHELDSDHLEQVTAAEFGEHPGECEISSSQGGEYEVQICLLGCTADDGGSTYL